jgi:hypothetical protein
VPQGRIEIAPGVGNLGQPDVPRACRGRGGLTEIRGYVRRLLVGLERRAETALRSLDLAE